MYWIALKMLVEERAKFIGMVLSLSFSAVIITQQSAIFLGLMRRTYGMITDTPQAEIWVMNRHVQMIDDLKPLRDTDLLRVRGIDGVAWAVPLYKGMIRAKLPDGRFQSCILIGIDENTFIGAPHTMIEGRVTDLRKVDGVILNKVGAERKLALEQDNGRSSRPMRVGDVFELNDRRAAVVGICDISRTFQSQPVVYTTYTRALQYAPFERKLLSFILVKSNGKITPQELCRRIEQATEFAAYTKHDFEQLTRNYYLKNTGIPINFGLAVLLGLLVGAAIAGLIFYNFTTDNLRYLALFSTMGASKWLLAKMTLLQALWVAVLGWGIGTGAAALIGFFSRKTELSFYMPWQLFVGVGIIIFFICFIASLMSIARIYHIELGTMFK